MVQKPNLEGVDVISWKQFWGEFGISDTQEFMETAVTIPVKQSIIFLSIVSNDLSLYQHIVLIVDRWPTVSMVHLSCRSKETCRLATELHWAWHGDNICAYVSFINFFDANFSDPLTIKKSHCETFYSPEQVEQSFVIVFFSSPPSHWNEIF